MNRLQSPDELERDRSRLRGTARPRRWLRPVISVAVLAALAGAGWWGWNQFGPGKAQTAAKAAPGAARREAVPVAMATVERKPMPVEVNLVGTVQSVASIPIKARIDSQIIAVKVAEGAKVTAGQVLFDLDDRTLKAQLAQAEAQIAKDRAQRDQARRDAERLTNLSQRGIASEVQRDTALTALKAIDAQLQLDEANRTNVATALGYATIRSPVNGRIGTITAKTGSVVRLADTAPIAIVNQIDPIYVSVALPQDRLPELRAAMANGTARVEITSGPDKLSGKIAFIENSVDVSSGTILVRAAVDNPQEKLWPGTFVKVQLVLDVEPNATVVPTAAVQMGQDSPYLFWVDSENRAHLGKVSVLRTIGNELVIAPPMDAGTRVVTDGVTRLTDGAVVTDARAPKAAPKPDGATKPDGAPKTEGGQKPADKPKS